MRVLRPDDLLPQGEGRWTPETVGNAFAECARQLRAHLADPEVLRVIVLIGLPGAGKTTWAGRQAEDPTSVLYDVVNAHPGRRAALARRIRDAGKDAIAVVVSSPISLCLNRNALRPVWRRVPEAFIRKTAIALRRDPPTVAEGWTRVEHVDGALIHCSA